MLVKFSPYFFEGRNFHWGGGFQDFMFSSPYLGNIPILTHMFQRG